MIPNSSPCLGSFCRVWFQNDHFIISFSLCSAPRDHCPQYRSTLDDATRQLFPVMCSSPQHALLPAIQTGNPYNAAVVRFKVSPLNLPWRQNPKRASHPGQTSALHMWWMDQQRQRKNSGWTPNIWTAARNYFLDYLSSRPLSARAALCAPTKPTNTHSSS